MRRTLNLMENEVKWCVLDRNYDLAREKVEQMKHINNEERIKYIRDCNRDKIDNLLELIERAERIL